MISVITPVWNQSQLTHLFLFQNWQFYEKRPDVEFVVINNGSVDNTFRVLDIWRELMGSHLKVINLPENIGFGPANNKGAKEAKGDTLVFISNDVIVQGDYISLLPIGDNQLCGPELIGFDTGWNKFNGATIPYLAGWCLACTRKTWDTLGGFDERFIPVDYEDMDLSYTAQQKDIELKAFSLPLKHMFGQSAVHIEGGREKVTFKNQERFKEKWGL